MKAWWDQLQPIELPANIRRNTFRAAFSKKLDLSGNDFELAPNVYEQLASALANVTKLKELNLSGDRFALTKEQPIKHFNFDLANTKITYSNGDVYEGEWKEGKRHGQGKITWPTGVVYEGNWKEGKRTGKGKYTWTSGAVYEGDWEDAKLTEKEKKR